MSELPKGWTLAQLGRVVQLKTGPFGSALHQSDYVLGGTPLINPTHIRGGRLIPDPSVSAGPEKTAELKEFRLMTGDVVMGRRGEMGRCAVVPQSAEGWLCGTGSVIVRPTHAVSPTFLQRFLSAPSTVSALVGDSVGSTMVNLNQKILLGLSVALPPVSEQRRIADKLDTVLTRVDAVSARLARVAPLLKRFRQSVLESKTRGNAPEQELRFLLQTVRTGPFGSALHKSDYVQGGIPVVNPMHIIDGEIHSSGHMTVMTETAARLSEFRLMAGDVVIGRRGEMGRCAVVSKAQAGWLCGTGSMILRPKEDVNPHFLRLVLSRPSSVRALEGDSVGSTMINLNQGILLSLQVSRPSTEEQAQIVRRVDTLFAFADRLEARLKSAQAAVGRLTPALLAKAFRGELVPQDPDDEPASELLRRLQAASDQRAPARAAGRGRKRSI